MAKFIRRFPLACVLIWSAFMAVAGAETVGFWPNLVRMCIWWAGIILIEKIEYSEG